MSERASDTFRMPDSYYEPPDDQECPECEQPFDGDECECGFEVPEAAGGYDRIEEVRGER